MSDVIAPHDGAGSASRRGIVMILLSVLLWAVGFRITRLAVAGSTPLTVSFLSNASSVLCFFLLGAAWRRLGWKVEEFDTLSWSALRAFTRGHARWLTAAALLLALNGWLTNTSLALYGADMTAFLSNMVLVFLVAAGWAMGERSNLREAVAIVLTVGGAFVFSYHGGNMVRGAIALNAVACVVIAGKQIFVKHVSGRSPLPVVMCAVTGLSLPWTVALLFQPGAWRMPGLSTLGWSALGGIMVSVVSMALCYRAYHLIGVARAAPFNALRPVLVLAAGIAAGQGLPSSLQVVGGLLIVAGSLGLTMRRGALEERTPIWRTGHRNEMSDNTKQQQESNTIP